MVVSGHPLATLAGWSALERGGSAVDAAIAAAAVLTVALPQAVAIGGDAVALVYDASARRVRALNATGPAPGALEVGSVTRAALDSGPLSPTVPGLVAGWAALHNRFGRLSWVSLLEPAISVASEGFIVSRTFAATIEEYRQPIAREPALADDLLP